LYTVVLGGVLQYSKLPVVCGYGSDIKT